jgi:TolB-like protein
MEEFDRKVLKFSHFSVDLARGCLRKGQNEVSLRPKTFEVLIHLASNAGKLVRKEELADVVWPNVTVSDASLVQCIRELRQKLGDDEHHLIKTVSRRGYLLDVPTSTSDIASGQDPEAAKTTAAEFPSSALPLPDRPSIAVLPFTNLSGELEQEYFADGIVEDIITALSRMRWLFVIARNSSFTYKGRTVDAKQVGRELGVRYLLEGSVRKSVNRVRIAGQLIDASTGTHLWADRFDGALDDIFDLQDRVTESVVGAIEPKLHQAEIERAMRKPTASLDAYDTYLRGLARIRNRSNEANDEALALWRTALALDPEFALAYAMATFCYCRRKGEGWITQQDVAETRRLARRAVEFGKDDAGALCFAGYALAFVVGELDDGAAFVDQALILNPNLAHAWHWGGWTKLYLGEPDAAIGRQARAMRLSPVDPSIYMMQSATAHAHFFAGRYREASSWARMALREQPDYQSALRIAASSYVLDERHEEAREMMARLRQGHPALRLANLRNVLGPYRQVEYVSKYEDALRKAGLPE